ncbi:hypothetical protein GIB67_002899, partial [Kingdonia uniflora]
MSKVFKDYFYQSDQVYNNLKAGGSFRFPTKKGTDMSPKYLNFFESKNSEIKWSWGIATLARLYYSLGASSRVNAKALICCTTLLEIFEYFPKLYGIPKLNDSRAREYCTRWSWSRSTSDRSGEKALKIFREALDNYKLEDTDECERLKVSNDRLQANLKVKQDLSKTKKKLNDKCNSFKETYKKLSKDVCSLKESLADLNVQSEKKVEEYEKLTTINEKLIEEVVAREPQPLAETKLTISEEMRFNLQTDNDEWEVWCLALKGSIEGRVGDFQDPDDPTWEELDIRDVERDGNTMFGVAASYTYQSQLKFLNVRQSLCSLMTNKPSYWKSVFSQTLDKAYNDLGER